LFIKVDPLEIFVGATSEPEAERLKEALTIFRGPVKVFAPENITEPPPTLSWILIVPVWLEVFENEPEKVEVSPAASMVFVVALLREKLKL
jgi:hypothetical protein